MSNCNLYQHAFVGAKTTILKYLSESIFTGATLTGSIETLENGNKKLVQSWNIDKSQLTIDHKQLRSVNLDLKAQNLQKDAIVVLSRGDLIANVFKGDEADQVIASHTFFIINLSDSAKSILRPEYVAWYINKSGLAKRHFDTNARGTNLQMTSIQSIKELPILIPRLSEQDAIVKNYIQMKNDVKALIRMAKLREEYNDSESEQLLADVMARQGRQSDYM